MIQSMKKILVLLLCLSMIFCVSCSKDIEKLKEEYITVKIEVRDFGTMTVNLYPEIAPITVENFVTLAEEGFYDGLIFHRIIEGFMIQGGDPSGTGYGLPDQPTIKGEFSYNSVENPLSHKRGVISMARGNSYNSATSQFFICHGDSYHLDGQYAAFGELIEGFEVLDAIATVETGTANRPTTDVVIETIYVVE